MEVGEPSEKVGIPDTRGGPQLETINETLKQGVKNEAQTIEGEEKHFNGAGPKTTRAIYTWEDLKALKDAPASKVWPSFIEEDCMKNGVWDPEIWHHTPASAKRCASPVDEIKRQIIIEDGIVLSPQRQSFGQGCHFPQSAPERGSQHERTRSMLSRTTERDGRDGRSRLTGRVGRGSRSMDSRNNQRERSTRNGDFRQTSPWERDRNEKEFKRNKDEDAYNYRRGKKRYEEPEPEWMTYGPTSQLETIELRGFDREEMFGKRNKSGSLLGGSDSAPISADKKGKAEEQKKNEKNKNSINEQEKDFDINQFFISDTFLKFSDMPENGNSNASRFCQFFGIGERKDGSRRSSAAEELLEYSGLSSGSPSTPRTPSPNQNFMFTPIKSIDASTEPENLAEMLEKTKIDVKPLLESVMSSSKNDMDRIKGQCRLEDIEKMDKNTEQGELPVSQEEAPKKEDTNSQDMSAFFKLVENMKTSGHLPEKPQPVIPGLPSRLLPRPPSPKTKQPRNTPSPVEKLGRSPSPMEVLHHMMQGHRIPSPPVIPSPPQVVPQIDRSYSPYGNPTHKTIELLRRSPSPLMYDQSKHFSPLLTPDAFMSPAPMHQHPPIRESLTQQYFDKPHFELPTEFPTQSIFKTPRQKEKSNNFVITKAMPKSQSSALKDLAFMPTSVLQKIKKDQMTPKSKEGNESRKEKIENEIEYSMKNRTTGKHPTQPSLQQYPPGKEQPKSMFQPFSQEATLLKPTAFKPYHGKSSQGSISPLRSGVHSEPNSPVASRTLDSPSHHQVPITSSAPVTPQRPAHAEHQLMCNQVLHFHQLTNGPTSRAEEFNRDNDKAGKGGIQGKQCQTDRGIPNSHQVKVPEENINFSNDFGIKNELGDFNIRHDHEQKRQQQRQFQHAIQQHQQQLRRDALVNQNQMFRNRPTTPHLIGQVSPQAILGSAVPTRTPYNTPISNIHHQNKQGIYPAMGQPPLHPYLRMVPPRIPPMQPQAALMQMMPPNRGMVYGPGHTPMPGHHGYGPMNPQIMGTSANFLMQRHSGLVTQQGKVPSSIPRQQDPNHRLSPSDNVLSKWFTDDVLRGAPHPKIPSAHDKKVMSVEDLERQQSMSVAFS